MKKIILSTLVMLLIVNFVSAQKQGTIVYEQSINLHKSLSPKQQALKAMIPETTTKKNQFIFNEEKGCLKNLPTDSPKGMVINVGGSDKPTWINFQKEIYRKYIDIDDELYHTENTIDVDDAKPTGNSKKILNFACDEYKSADDTHSFWVSKELPKHLTPMVPLFLDGAILAIENEKISFLAISFSQEIDTRQLIPLESEEITSEQFEDLQEEKLNEMKAMGGKVMKMEN